MNNKDKTGQSGEAPVERHVVRPDGAEVYEPAPARCAHGVNPPSACKHCSRQSGAPAPEPVPTVKRANYVGAPRFFELNQACRLLVDAFGYNIYLVGSSIERRDFRDVDVRAILSDEEYARLFPGLSGNPSLNALWSLMCTSISLWLSKRTGLPIDFQIQQQTEANANNPGAKSRHPLGIFLEPKP